MGEKNKKNNGGEQKSKEDNKKKENGDKNNITVVLKADLHCEGCASKVIKCIRSFDGVEAVTVGDGQKISVIGKVDPVKLREKVEQKTHKKVELISPVPNKKESAKGKDNSGDKDQNSNEKKSKEKLPPVTTAVLKVNLHCEGCIQKIHKIVTKTKGYQEMKIDRQKELVTVTGAMDMKELADILKKHLKKDVDIVPPKKEGDKKEKSGGGDKGKPGGGDGGSGGGGGEKMDGNRMQVQIGYPYPFMYGSGSTMDQFQYNPYAVGSNHAPQMFSDENPNACSVM